MRAIALSLAMLAASVFPVNSQTIQGPHILEICQKYFTNKQYTAQTNSRGKDGTEYLTFITASYKSCEQTSPSATGKPRIVQTVDWDRKGATNKNEPNLRLTFEVENSSTLIWHNPKEDGLLGVVVELDHQDGTFKYTWNSRTYANTAVFSFVARSAPGR